jgi:hypothetical protein
MGKKETREEVWNKYMKRLAFVKPDTNKPKKGKGNVKLG